MTTDIKRLVRAEVTSQLKELKEQIDKELVESLHLMERNITNELTARLLKDVDRKVKSSVDPIKKEINEISTHNKSQMVLINDKQLEAQRNTKQLVLAVAEGIQNNVYDKVFGEINETLMPKFNALTQWVNYNTQDGDEVVDSYRRAVEQQSLGQGLLTNNDSTKFISPHVRTFFDDDY